MGRWQNYCPSRADAVLLFCEADDVACLMEGQLFLVVTGGRPGMTHVPALLNTTQPVTYTSTNYKNFKVT